MKVQSHIHGRLKPKYVNINNIIQLHRDLLPACTFITLSLSSHPLADDTQSNQVAHQPETVCLFLSFQHGHFCIRSLETKSHINYLKSHQQGWLLARIFEGSHLCFEDREAEFHWTFALWSKVFLARPDRLQKVQLTLQLPLDKLNQF